MAESLNSEREAFWAELARAEPDLGILPSPGWEKEVPVGPLGLKFKVSLSQDRTSVYLFARTAEGRGLIEQNLAALAVGLRTTPGQATGEADAGRWFRKNARATFTVRRQWPEAIRWIGAQHGTFAKAMAAITS